MADPIRNDSSTWLDWVVPIARPLFHLAIVPLAGWVASKALGNSTIMSGVNLLTDAAINTAAKVNLITLDNLSSVKLVEQAEGQGAEEYAKWQKKCEGAISERMNMPIPTDIELKSEFDKFGTNIARVVPTRLIDRFICGSNKPEDFYIEMNAGVRTDADLKVAFYNHLDNSELFFLVRWVAKLVYWLFFPMIKSVIQETVGEMNKHLTSQLAHKQNNEFNKLVEQELEQSNRFFEEWIATFHKIAKAAPVGEEVFSLERALKDELMKPEHLNGLSPDEFYTQVTQKFMQVYYPGVSIGKAIYDRLMAMGISESSAFSFMNVFIKIVTFPVACLFRIAFLIPDLIFNKIFASTIEKALIRYRAVEDVVNKILEAVSTNKGLSLPVLKVLNETLEELFIDIRDNPPDESIKERLTQTNQEALERNIDLSLKAVDLFDNATVGDLKKFIQAGSPPSKGYVDAVFDKEVTKGVEQVIMTIYQRFTDPNFIKQKSYYILQAVNHSLTSNPNSPEESDQECVRQEARSVELIKKVVALSITKKIQARAESWGLWKDSATVELAIKKGFDHTYSLVSKTVDMVKSPYFLRFQLNQILSEFLKTKYE